MKLPGIPADEAERLTILDDLGIVYSPAEERFDRITRLARRIFNVPIALVSLVTANTQWFKSSQGLLAGETTREISFCGHAILGNDTFIVRDATKDPDFADNPLVTGEPHVCFYAGHPIRLNSVKLGTFCIIDRRPRRFDEADIDTLKSLALWVENELKLGLYSASQNELMKKVGSLTRKSLIDPATGCWNQRGVDKLLYSELERSQRDQRPVAVLMIEVKPGEQYAPFVSSTQRSEIYKSTAQAIRGVTRTHDVLGKLDDDLFLVFLSNCPRDTCQMLTQRILRNISVQRIKLDDKNIKLEVKIGVACNDTTDVWSPTRLVETATIALDIAKDMDKPNASHLLLPNIAG